MATVTELADYLSQFDGDQQVVLKQDDALKLELGEDEVFNPVILEHFFEEQDAD